MATRVSYSLTFHSHTNGYFSTPGFNNIYWSRVPMHTQCIPPPRLVPTFRDDRNPRVRTWITQRCASRSRQRTIARRAQRPAELTAKPELAEPNSAVRPFSTTDEHSDSQVGRSSSTKDQIDEKPTRRYQLNEKIS